MLTLDAQLPRVFQTDIEQLFAKVARPGLTSVTMGSWRTPNEASEHQHGLLTALGEEVEDSTANTASRAFACALSELFGRQLAAWARALDASVEGTDGTPPAELLAFCAEHAKIDLIALGLRADLNELLLVGDVMRHGEGPSAAYLRRVAPGLWDHEPTGCADTTTGLLPASESLHIREGDLDRYARAMGRFWAHVVPQPFDVAGGP